MRQHIRNEAVGIDDGQQQQVHALGVLVGADNILVIVAGKLALGNIRLDSDGAVDDERAVAIAEVVSTDSDHRDTRGVVSTGRGWA